MADSAKKFLDARRDPFWREVLEREASYLRRKLTGCERILDAGCGIGVMEALLADLDIVGLDSDPAMLEEARRATAAPYVLGNMMRLPFRDAALDAVFFVTSLEFVDDFRFAVQEVARVLKERGKFVAMMLNPKSWHFRNRAKRRDSYLRSIRVREPELVRDYSSRFFTTEAVYFLGIKEGRVFNSKDENLAALYVVKGCKG